jgi:metal-sulfur cluster biosynthetic enzyme
MSDPDRVAEVLARLGHVTDPELDEPVTELGFVTGVAVDPDGAVAVEFRLPTYWCAANFAFMMADDMRREVSVLPWVTRVEPHLGEHMYAEKINHGVRQGLSFQEAFAEEAAGDLDELRRTFLVKAFQRRQEALILHLRGIGQAAETVTALSLDALRRLKLDVAGERLRARYLERRGVAGPAPAEALAFVDAQGHALVAADLPMYLRGLRRIGTNAEFNGALCSGLLAARFDEAPIEPANVLGGEPTLRDFIRDAARGTATQGRAA